MSAAYSASNMIRGYDVNELIFVTANLPTIPKKVEYVEGLLNEGRYFEKLIKGPINEKKSNGKSLEERHNANALFREKKYFEAMEKYNKSLCYAERGSENIAMAYANRSAILLEWKRYRECLINIELARNANYPENLMEKLDKREETCIQLLDTQVADDTPFDFKLAGEPHGQIPSIVDCLEMRKTEEQGRTICTTRDLKVGDLIASEEPFCSTIVAAQRYVHCANCKNENYVTLLPCKKCCCVMFCSEECRKQANNGFHKYECDITHLIHVILDEHHLITMRVCLSALELFPTIDELMAFCEQSKNQNKSAFDLDYEVFTPREHYRAIHGLITNQHLRSEAEMFDIALNCALMKNILFKYTSIKRHLCGEEGENFFVELLFRHFQTSLCNSLPIGYTFGVNDITDILMHSFGTFAFLSLINHSCAPNTIRVFKGTRAYLFALRPIKAGGVIYGNYGTHFTHKSSKDRIAQLSTQFHFTCKCEACAIDYYTLYKTVRKPNIPYLFKLEDVESFHNCNFQFALENYSKYANFLMEYQDEYPCEQITYTEGCLIRALHILMCELPLDVKVEITAAAE